MNKRIQKILKEAMYISDEGKLGSEDYPTLDDLESLHSEFVEAAEIVQKEVESNNSLYFQDAPLDVDRPTGSFHEQLSQVTAPIFCRIMKTNMIPCQELTKQGKKYAVATLSNGDRYAVVPSFDGDISYLKWL